MQSIVDFILKEELVKQQLFETKGDPIDEQWLNDETPR